MRYYVSTDAALGRIFGVSRAAVSKARLEGRITPRSDGWYDVLAALVEWRESTFSGYVRGRPDHLDPEVPLAGRRLGRLLARCRAEGAVEDGGDGDDDANAPRA